LNFHAILTVQNVKSKVIWWICRHDKFISDLRGMKNMPIFWAVNWQIQVLFYCSGSTILFSQNKDL